MMSPLVARSVASLYGCKPNLKNWHVFEAFVYKFLGGRPTTETTGMIMVVLMTILLEPIKNTKNLKSLLVNLLHRRPLKTISRAMG